MIAAVDVGGTKIALGLVDAQGTVHARAVITRHCGFLVPQHLTAIVPARLGYNAPLAGRRASGCSATGKDFAVGDCNAFRELD
jgi:predicted NBD/HSP70 family sugar kinase